MLQLRNGKDIHGLFAKAVLPEPDNTIGFGEKAHIDDALMRIEKILV